MSTFDMTIGLLFRRQVRCELNKMMFKGLDIKFIEAKGFTQSEFTIKGSDKDVNSVLEWIKGVENDLSKH